VKLSKPERNYHIFYMLLAGASVEQRRLLSLKQAEQFSYLIQGDCVEIDRRNDSEEFNILCSAMNSLRFDPSFQASVFACLAGILHFGKPILSSVKYLSRC
jgi:myosin heavy subunit